MSRRNQGRTSPFASEPKRSNNLIEDDERILGAINAADASMQVAHPTSIHDLDPDPTQPRRVVPSAVRKAVPTGFKTPDLLEWWAVMAHQERYGHKPGDPHQAHFYLRSVVAGEPNERDGEPGIIEAALLRVADLAADIRARGKLIHPIHITSTGRIITGERRWLAHHLLTRYDYAGFDKIMAVESEYDVWVQASENNQRSDLNAIGRARQFAILLMDLLKREGAAFEPLRAFEDEQDYYAQVADSKLHRIPTGGLNQIMNAMGLKGRQTISDYRQLLSLPKDVWVIADDEGWSKDDLLKIVRSTDNFVDDEGEPDGDPGQDAPVGESEAIPIIPISEQPFPVEDYPNILVLNLDQVPSQLSWWGAYKDLKQNVSDRLLFVEVDSGCFALLDDAQKIAQIVPSTMPDCHYTDTNFGMTFFCQRAIIEYVAQRQAVAICDMHSKEHASLFWYEHMVKNRQAKPVQTASTTPPPATEAPARQKWMPRVGEQVVVQGGHLGKVTGLYPPSARVRTQFGERLHPIYELRPATDADLERDTPPPGFESPGETGLPHLPLNQMLDYLRQHSSYGRVPWSARRAGSGVFLDDGKGVNLGKLFWNSGFGEYLARVLAAVFTLILPSAESVAFIRVRSFEEDGGNASYLPGDAVQDAREVIEYLQGFVDRTEREMDWGPEE